MDEALQLLKGGRVGPQQGDLAAFRAQGELRQVLLSSASPFGMVG